MKVKICALALILPAMNATASNTITFYGEVANSTCNVLINGSSGNVAIQLPTVEQAQLSKGNAAGGGNFTFTVSGCQYSNTIDQIVGIRLLPVSGDVTESGNLTNTSANADKASNVSIQILDGGIAGGTVVDFRKGEYLGTTQPIPDDAPAIFTYGARYFSEGMPDTGKVESRLQYALTYK